MRLMSTRTGGLARRSFISGSKLWPPANTLASSFPLSRSTASTTDRGAAYLKDAGIIALHLPKTEPGTVKPPHQLQPYCHSRSRPTRHPEGCAGVERRVLDQALLGRHDRRVDS